MTKISKKEVQEIAAISHVSLDGEEVARFVKKLEEVLSYAERVKEVAVESQEPKVKAVNIFREDVVISSDASEILSQSPGSEEQYFVVPNILSDAK